MRWSGIKSCIMISITPIVNIYDQPSKEYVLGFLFNEERNSVILIQKEKPKWQAGLLNGVGGKIEKTDYRDDGKEGSIRNAMVREFYEETGVVTDKWKWRSFTEMHGKGWIVYCYCHFNTAAWSAVKTLTSELIVTVPIAELSIHKTVSNIPWLIPMALDENYGNPPFYAFVKY